MKTPSDELFKLIKSMNIAEKRHFKLYAMQKNAGSKSKTYLELFDAINKQSSYNEFKLASNIKKKGVINNLIKAKNYLHESIINFLAHHHSGTTANSQIRNLLEKAEILENKRLFKQALKTILKAEKLALSLENYPYLIIINNQKLNIYIHGNLLPELEAYQQNGIKASADYMKHLSNFIEIKNLNILATLNYLRKRKYGEFNKQEVKYITDSPFIKSLTSADSFPAKVSLNNIHNILQALTPRNKKVEYERLKKWLTYLENNNDRLQNAEEHYIVAFSTLSLLADQMSGGLNELKELYNKLALYYTNLPTKKKSNQLILYYIRILNNYMEAFLKFGVPDMASIIFKEIKKVENFHAKAESNSSTKMLLYYNMFYAAFIQEKFREALKWLTNIIYSKGESVIDIQSAARVSVLLVHSEMGNFDLLHTQLNKSKRFLLKNNHFSPFEKTMHYFFEKEYPAITSKNEKTKAFERLERKLKLLYRKQLVPENFHFFDYFSWIKSKIYNRPFLDVLKEKTELS